MDANGARELARRIGSNAGLAPQPVPVDVPADSLPLSRWVGVVVGTRATEPSPPAKRSTLRRFRLRGR